MENKLISIDNMSAGYDDFIAINNINLDIFEKDFIGIIGPNGGGKTTLMKVILGLLKPCAGQVVYYDHGQAVDKIPTGYLPQRNNIDHRFPISVQDVVSSGLLTDKLFARNNKDIKSRTEEVLEMIGMTDKRRNSIGELSGGQMQRVMLGRAIINKPRLLVLDEPNSYIDKRFEEKLYQLLREINKDTTILMVSHEVTSLVDMVNRTVSIDGTLKPADLTCPYHHNH